MATPISKFSDAQKRGNALLIFCRAPVLGAVKTRLAATLGAPLTLQIYRAMLRDCFALGRALAPAVTTLACFTPPDAFDDAAELRALWDGARLPQRDGDLGARMLGALADARAQGFARAIIIGSDAPDLPTDALRRAFDLLAENEVVVGPSVDGGFVLLGAARDLPAAIFDGITWSRADVCARLKANLDALGLRYTLLPSWHDVDEIADLRALQTRLQSGETRADATSAVVNEIDLSGL